MHKSNEVSLKFESTETNTSLSCDYLVIGSGPGGSVAAYELAKAGHQVLIIEEGNFYSKEFYRQPISKLTTTLYRNGGINPIIGKPPIALGEGKCVGGGSQINGGLLWRTPDNVYEEWSNLGIKQLTKESLTPFFEKIESMLNVSYKEDNPHSNKDSSIIHKTAQSKNWKSVPVPRAIKKCIDTNLCGTGCPTGAKQTMVDTYLKEACNNGAKILCNTKAKKILTKGKNAYQVLCEKNDQDKNKEIKINFKKLFLAMGTIHTPHLIKRSCLKSCAGNQFKFHLNLKVVAQFPFSVNAHNGTIFTHQVQEFEKEGLLMMASNWQPHFAAVTLSHFGSNTINQVLKQFNRSALFVSQIRSKSTGKIISKLGKNPLPIYSFHSEDLKLAKFSLEKMGDLLLSAHAQKIYLPVRDSRPISKVTDLMSEVDKIKAENLDLLTVHTMASCPMGLDENFSGVNPEGKLWHYDNIWVTDASIIPDNIGESPQGTIMALSHLIMDQHLAQHG